VLLLVLVLVLMLLLVLGTAAGTDASTGAGAAVCCWGWWQQPLPSPRHCSPNSQTPLPQTGARAALSRERKDALDTLEAPQAHHKDTTADEALRPCGVKESVA